MVSGESATVVRVVFRLTDERYPIVRISREESCRFELLRFLPRGENCYAEFFSVTDADPAAVQRRAEAADAVDSRLLAEENSAGLFEFEVSEASPTAELAVQDAIPTTVTSEEGTARIEVGIVPPPEPSTVVDAFRESHPDATLVEMSDTERSVPLFTGSELELALEERLTERQLEVLRTAYESGYYQRPRETTGEELAGRLDISVATFSQHVRVAERHLLALVFENGVV